MRVKPWIVEDTEHLLDCRVFSVLRTHARSPVDRSVHEFFRIASPDWAQIVPVTCDDEVVLVRQYRHGSDELSLEVPAGMIDEGEDPPTAAARECLEETGYRVSNVQSLGVMRPNPALFTNHLHTFVAYGAERVAEIEQTATEQTEVERVPIDEIADMLCDGRIDHALDVALLWRFLHERG